MNKPNEFASYPSDEYLTSIQNFAEHVKSSVTEMIDIIDNGGDYEDRFAIILEVNGQKTKVEMHADAYDRLMSMLETEMAEYIELHPSVKEETTLDKIDRAMDANDFETAKRLQDQFLDDMLAGVE
jgi:hypothetical protein